MGKKRAKKLLKQMQNELVQIQHELKMIRVRQDWAEQSISNLQKSSLKDGEASSKLDGRVFKLEYDLIGATGAAKLLECDIKSLRDRVDALAKASREK